MINLLPNTTKDDIKYARYNMSVVKWIVAIFLGLSGMVLIVIGGHLFIQSSINAYAKQAKDGHARLEAQDLQKTQKDVQELGDSLKLTIDVLSRSVLFSELLQGIGSVMPNGASLQTLSISKVDGAIDLQVQAVDYQTATQVQVNLADADNKIFEKADIISINCQPNTTTPSQYPCIVGIRALFAKDNQFTFISKAGSR